MSRYELKLHGSKISHLTIDQVYPTYVHYRKSMGNLLIQMELILAGKVHILVHFFVLYSFIIHAGDCWGLKGVNEKKRVATFMKSCDFCEKLRLS